MIRWEATAKERLRVLQSFRGPQPTTNPYLVELLRATRTGADVTTFTWRTALLGRYDVLHMHWPEVILRGRDRWRTAVRQALFATLMTRLRLRKTALVRTVHNTRPHEAGGAVERALLRLCDRTTTMQIRLNAELPSPLTVPEEVILLAHYGGWFRGRAVPRTLSGRLLYFGLIRPYKGVPHLLDAFEKVSDPDLTLRIVGSCSDIPLAAQISAGAERDARVSINLSYVDDDQLAREVGEAELVVLPYLGMGNSGALLTALSLGRPVVAPASPLTSALAAEVGPGWVLTYEGLLTPQHLTGALTAVRSTDRAATPDLSRREWSVLGPQHLRAYARAVLIARNSGRRPS